MYSNRRVIRIILISAILLVIFLTYIFVIALNSSGPDAQLDELNNKYATLEAEKKRGDVEYEALQNAYNNLYYRANEEGLKAQQILQCPWSVPFDFSNNDTVHQGIKDFVNQNFGKVTDSNWEPVYSGSDNTTFHHFYTEGGYYNLFIVFLDDPNEGTSNGVFDINDQCWINLGEREKEPPGVSLNEPTESFSFD